MIILLEFKSSLAAAYSGLSGIYVEKNNLELAEIYAQKASRNSKITKVKSLLLSNTLE
jgi:hypothetical protein